MYIAALSASDIPLLITFTAFVSSQNTPRSTVRLYFSMCSVLSTYRLNTVQSAFVTMLFQPPVHQPCVGKKQACSLISPFLQRFRILAVRHGMAANRLAGNPVFRFGGIHLAHGAYRIFYAV